MCAAAGHTAQGRHRQQTERLGREDGGVGRWGRIQDVKARGRLAGTHMEGHMSPPPVPAWEGLGIPHTPVPVLVPCFLPEVRTQSILQRKSCRLSWKATRSFSCCPASVCLFCPILSCLCLFIGSNKALSHCRRLFEGWARRRTTWKKMFIQIEIMPECPSHACPNVLFTSHGIEHVSCLFSNCPAQPHFWQVRRTIITTVHVLLLQRGREGKKAKCKTSCLPCCSPEETGGAGRVRKHHAHSSMCC